MRRRNRRARREEWEDRAEEIEPSDLDAALDEDFNDDYGEAPFEPFVPVTDDDDQYEMYGGEPEAEMPEPRRRVLLPRPHLPRLRLPSFGPDIQWGYLLLALALIVGGIFGALLNLGDVPARVEEWWPVVIVVIAALWMIVALVRRQAASFLGGSALGGVGLSLVMNNQAIADYQETLLGMVLVTAGLGIMIRGFLLRQRTPL